MTRIAAVGGWLLADSHWPTRGKHATDCQPLPSSIQPQVCSIRASSGSEFSALDSPLRDFLFARLDNDPTERIGGMNDEDDRDEKADGDFEDGLDLWPVLYGFDS